MALGRAAVELRSFTLISYKSFDTQLEEMMHHMPKLEEISLPTVGEVIFEAVLCKNSLKKIKLCAEVSAYAMEKCREIVL